MWFNEDAYTVPPRSTISEVQQTLIEVDAWSRNANPAHPEAVTAWLEAFEDQYTSLSKDMPKRQAREIGRESTREIVERIMTQLKRNSN